jgi:DNA-binding IclR family transcriptional regulator
MQVAIAPPAVDPVPEAPAPGEAGGKPERSSQTLTRALDILDAVRGGPISLPDLERQLGLSRSTVHRLATALVERRLLSHDPRKGYRLGARLMDLGFLAHEATDLATVAQPTLDAISQRTDDATNLAIRDGDDVVYIARSASRRRVVVRHRIGDRNRITDTALGRALLLDAPADVWAEYFALEELKPAIEDRFTRHVDADGDRICCIASPIRDASGAIVAALSLSSIPQYMTSERLEQAGQCVIAGADTISRQLGWGWKI